MLPHGIMFHHLHGGPHRAGQGSIAADELYALIEFLGRERVLPAREWFDRATRGTLKRRDVCLTFDDNLRCQFDVARPVLKELGLTGFWFVATSALDGGGPEIEIHRAFRERHFSSVDDFYAAFFWAVQRSIYGSQVERGLMDFNPKSFLSAFSFYSDSDRKFRFIRDELLGSERYREIMQALMASVGANPGELARDLWMDATCIRALHAEGHIIGLHTHTHPTRVAYLPAAEQEREYRDNYMTLMQLLGEPPQTMSHPCNSYSDVTLAILRKLGIRVGFRADLRCSGHDDLEFPRDDHVNVLRRMHTCKSPSSPATSRGTVR
jgi:peptidoglycan/xylan/chitin deacetylase (PgdA/CDA1 family)